MTYGSPGIPGGQEQIAVWPSTLQWDVLGHGLDTRHGSAHSPIIQLFQIEQSVSSVHSGPVTECNSVFMKYEF